MMGVQLILDSFGIDTENALQIEPTEESIAIGMREIKHHLLNPSEQLLRVRLKIPSLLKRFQSIEGLDHVLPTRQLIPRLLLSEKLKSEIPQWLSNEQIVALDLLKNTEFENSFESFEKNLLFCCNETLILGESFADFVSALRSQTPAFFLLLENSEIKNHLLAHLEFDLNISKEIGNVLLVSLCQANDMAIFLDTLAYQQHLFHLRQFSLRYDLEMALPALALPTELLSLPLLFFSESQAIDLIKKFIDVLNAAVRKVLDEKFSAEIIAELFISDWAILWRELSVLVDANPKIISDALAQKVVTFSSAEAIALAERFKQNTYSLLSSSATIEEVLDWSEGYFEYCRHAFLHKQPLDESINVSFTDWLLSQTARISRSQASWLHCSQQISKFLSVPDYAVVVIMVDALSAMNQDILLDELESLKQEQLTLFSENLFAPLPTLTEIGKLAVLTGKPTSELPSDQETALRETYQTFLPEKNSLKVGRSWRESTNETLNIQTKLFVIFENELDERLHKCSSFKKHYDDLIPISRQIKSKIKGLVKDAQYDGREVVFFITADHGMTVTQGFYDGESLGENKERCFKLKSANIELPANFVNIENFAIPKQRLRLTPDALLAHGGLTPEEVLIPFITLTTKPPELPKTKIEVSLENKQALRISDKQWQIDLLLTSNVSASDIQINMKDSIFLGSERVDSLRANKSQKVVLQFNAEQQQEGLVRIELVVSYRCATLNEQLSKFIDVNFIAPLLEKNASVQSFEDMF